jgi:hypothetical protein
MYVFYILNAFSVIPVLQEIAYALQCYIITGLMLISTMKLHASVEVE